MTFDDGETTEDVWLLYEKNQRVKLVKFTIKLSDTRIDFAEWVDGSKPKFQKRVLKSSQHARQEFHEIVASKKSSGFKFVNSKM